MLIDLPLHWIILLDITAWFVFHMGISLLCMKIPDAWYAKTESFYQPFAWEKNGELWQRLFRIKDWKKRLPEGSSIIKSSYNKKQLHGTDKQTFEKFIIETVFCKTFLHNIAKKKYTPLRLKFFSDYFGLDRACLSRKLSPVKLKMCA